jgi:hypothetical protein
LWRPPFKRTNPPPNNQNPSVDEIHLAYFAQENFCRAHNASHSERTCPAFVNMFKVFTEMEEEEENKTNENEQEDEETHEPSVNVIWDISRGIIDDDEEEVEEICVAQTRSKML